MFNVIYPCEFENAMQTNVTNQQEQARLEAKAAQQARVDDEAAREVLRSTVPSAVIEWLIENDAMFRCSTFDTGVHAG